MNVIWVTNKPTLQLAKAFKIKTSFGGGWMENLSMQLSGIDDFKLTIVFPCSSKYSGDTEKQVSNITGIAVPMKQSAVKPNDEVIIKYKNIFSKIKPDIIHIWGTEYIHSYCAFKACESLNNIDRTLVSVQGLVSVYAKHFWADINVRKLNFSFKDFILNKTLKKQYTDFIKRGKYEIETIKNSKHVIGRTDWDKACSKHINTDINYHFCNETLRPSFYCGKWNYDSCEKYSIFVSQCQYPIKGLHKLIEAMPLILKKFPNAHIYTTGKNKIANNIKEKLLQSSYDKYIEKLLKKHGILDKITFLGALDEERMCSQFLKANVFVSASSIENSPNSVGEAMLLGVPVVSSDVGGVKNMLNHEHEGFIYSECEPYMLAYYVSEIFEDRELCQRISESARCHASLTHNSESNLKRLVSVYSNLKTQ